VESVIDLHWNINAGVPCPRRSGGNDHALFENCRSKCREIILQRFIKLRFKKAQEQVLNG
jgi:hypothetical protein